MNNNPSSPFCPAYLYGKLAWLLNKLQSPLLLVIRLVWGGMFIQTGWGKWHDIPKVIGFFTSINIPFPTVNAYMVATTELVGGAFLFLGLLSRLTPIPLLISMVVAYITTEQDALQKLFHGNPDDFFAATPFLFLYAALIIWVFGPGVFSLDYLLGKKCCAKKENLNPVE